MIETVGRRTVLAVLLLALIAVGAWVSIPDRKRAFSESELAANRRFLFWPTPDRVTGAVEFDGGAVRLLPGASIRFSTESVNAMIQGGFQASTPNPATAEISIINRIGEREVLVRRELPSAQSGRRFFLIDALVADSRAKFVEISVPADSPAGVDWRELRALPRPNAEFARAISAPFFMYEGFTPPHVDDTTFYTHAPSEILLLVPPGRHRLSFTFGYNTALFLQRDWGSDGVTFRVALEDGPSARAFWEKNLDPNRGEAERKAQAGEVVFELKALSRVRLSALPGETGNNAWDWAFWREIRLDPAP